MHPYGTRNSVLTASILLAGLLVVPARTAAAAELPAARAALERLRLSPFGDGFAVHGTAGAVPKRLHVGLLANYEVNPVVPWDSSNEAIRDVITDRLTFDVVGGFRIVDWLEFGARMPLVVLQQGDTEGILPGQGASLDSFGVGDPELALRARLFRTAGGFAMALVAGGSLPTTGGGSFIGERGATFSPALALTRPIGDAVTLGLDLGATLRWDDDDYVPLEGGDEVFASLGGVVNLGSVSVIAELLTRTAVDEPGDADGNLAVEALGGVRAALGKGFHGTVGGGVGLIDSYGVPEYRVIAGIGWALGEESGRRIPEPEADREFAERTLAEAGIDNRPAPAAEPTPANEEPAYEEPAPRREVTEATEYRPARRETSKSQPSFHAAVQKEQVEVSFGNDDRLSPEARRELDAMVEGLGNRVNEIVWRVEGHSDNRGELVPNRRRSRVRAEAVSEYLQSRGMPAPGRVDWYGPQFPIADNGTAAGRAQNRRADVTVVIE